MDTLLRPETQRKFLRDLHAWYKKHGRHDMPWRKTSDPYAIFVSEYMLQQTTVATVRPYYDRFLRKFPTVKTLAQGDLNDVLALWSGLGYYARARHLWSAMRTIQSEHRGKIPSDIKALQELPGVGPYTAGAIASFAFDRPAAVLDGNIIRVLMRMLAIEDDPKLKEVQIILQQIGFELSNLAPKGKNLGRPREVNLALMDLGSTVCLPREPKCDGCPGAAMCLARDYGKQNEIPMKTDSKERPIVRRLFAAIESKGKFLLGQRPAEGLFGGLWEFIGADAPSGVDPINFLEEAVLRETGLKIRVREALTAFEHQLSHRIMLIKPFVCVRSGPIYDSQLKARSQQYERFKWVAADSLKRLGMSSITKRILALSR